METSITFFMPFPDRKTNDPTEAQRVRMVQALRGIAPQFDQTDRFADLLARLDAMEARELTVA